MNWLKFILVCAANSYHLQWIWGNPKLGSQENEAWGAMRQDEMPWGRMMCGEARWSGLSLSIAVNDWRERAGLVVPLQSITTAPLTGLWEAVANIWVGCCSCKISVRLRLKGLAIIKNAAEAPACIWNLACIVHSCKAVAECSFMYVYKGWTKVF